jgi:hypothetical protein
MIFPDKFDVIVVGGGHAGTEAALASARMGLATLLLTHNIETLGAMSCNPSIGGIGKGHLVKEVDALGGAMAIATDESGIQFRTLNSSKGPAVRATRAQADRVLYKQAIRARLENQANLALFQQAVDDLVLEGDAVAGVKTRLGIVFQARAVVLTTGTFLAGLIHVGLENFRAGRMGDPPAMSLAARLRELNLPAGRLKTGTPPRIDGRSIDFSVMQEQPGDEPEPVFSFIGAARHAPRPAAMLDHADERAHPRHHPPGPGPFAALYRGHRGRGPPLLPEHRGQDQPLRGQDRPQRVPGTGRADHPRVLPQRHLHQPALRCAAEPGALDTGAGERPHPAPGLRHRIRLLRSARTQAQPGKQGHTRPVFRRPDQRHHGL